MSWENRGSIPACAGEPSSGLSVASEKTVYPRVCGGTSRVLSGPVDADGLSPRVRGNLTCHLNCLTTLGSIPAYAGEPVEQSASIWSNTVYPRVCGGTEGMVLCPRCFRGLSPRMRGNLCVQLRMDCQRRSIPAYAGEPLRSARRRAVTRVYPRVCGGTRHSHCSLLVD